MEQLEFIYANMNSSKSARLIMDAFNHQTNNKKYIAFKPAKDTRSKNITSRATPTEIPAIVIDEHEVGAMYRLVEMYKPHVVFVDEVQFFSVHQIEEFAMIVDELNVRVICYGLMTNFKLELFDASKRLVELADSVTKISNECTQCKNEGVVNSRAFNGIIQTDGETVVIGDEKGVESYTVYCRKCFYKKLKEQEDINDKTKME